MYTHGEGRHTKRVHTRKGDYTGKGLHGEGEEETQGEETTRKRDYMEKKERTYKWKRYTRRAWNKHGEETI